MSTGDRAIVVEHALSSKRNLGLAIDVALAYGEIHASVLRNGMNEVERLVRSGLDSDDVRIENDFVTDPLGRDAGLYVRRAEWLPGVRVGLEAEGANHRKGFLGVTRDQNVTHDVPSTATLSEALGRPGKTNPWWLWWDYLNEPYLQWDSKEALVRFWSPESGSSEAATYLSDQILWMVKSVDGLLTP